MVPKGIKLDGRLRRELESINRKRGEAMMQAEYDGHVATVVAAVDKRLRAEWEDAAKQADMAVLHKYHYAAPVKGANVRVYDPETKRYDQTFGIQHRWRDILISGQSYLGPMEKEEDRGLYYDCYVRQDDADYPGVYAIVEWRKNRKAEIAAEAETFHAAIRETASYPRIVERFPWLDTDEHRPYFATVEFPAKQRAFREMCSAT